MKNEEFDKIIKEKLLSNNTPPPSNGWENISAQVGEGGQVAGWKIITAVVLFLGLGGVGTYLYTTSSNNYEVPTQDEVYAVMHKSEIDADKAEEPVIVQTASILNTNPNTAKVNSKVSSEKNSYTAQIEDTNVVNNEETSTKSTKDETAHSNGEPNFIVNNQSGLEDNIESNNPVYKLLPKSFEEEADFLKVDIKEVALAANSIAFEEEEKEKPIKEKNYVITGVYLDAQSFLNYNRIKPNQNDDVLVSSLKNNKFNERVGFNFSAGIHKEITPRLSWYTGLVYQTYISKVEYSYQNRTADSLSVSLENGVYTATPNIVEQNDVLEQRVNSIGLESGLKYLIPARNFNNVFNIGLFGTTALNGKELNYIDNQQLFLKFGYGAYYTTKSPWTVFAQPSLSYSLLSENKDGGIFHIQPFSLGLTLGVTYRFVK